MKPTRKEAKAIAALRSLADTWPETLWIFAATNALHVMLKTRNRDVVSGHAMTASGCVDQEYILESIPFDVDGGDW